MDLALDANQTQIRDTLQGFVRSEVTPKAGAWDVEGVLPRARLQQLAELGMLGIMVDEAAGGVALGLLDATLVLEDIAFGDSGLAAAVLQSFDSLSRDRYGSGVLSSAMVHGTPAARAALLARVVEQFDDLCREMVRVVEQYPGGWGGGTAGFSLGPNVCSFRRSPEHK